MTGVESDLMALRQAAHLRDHEQLQFLLKRLLMRLPFYHAMVIAIERTHGYVETFERCHPEAVWARQVLVYIATVGLTPGNLPDEAMRDYTTPGSANFVKAVFDLGNAAFQEHPLEARIGFLASAVVHAIMAELVEAWYGERLADWERVRQNQFDPEAAQIALRFWTDDTIARRDTEAWLEIADRVEQHINRS